MLTSRCAHGYAVTQGSNFCAVVPCESVPGFGTHCAGSVSTAHPRRPGPVACGVRQVRAFALVVVPLSGCLAPPVRSSGEGARLAIISGNQQGAPLRQPLLQPLTVGVFDGGGTPAEGARVARTVPHGDRGLRPDRPASLGRGG